MAKKKVKEEEEFEQILPEKKEIKKIKVEKVVEEFDPSIPENKQRWLRK